MREAERAIEAAVRSFGFDRVLAAVVREARGQADSRAVDVGEARYGADRCSLATIEAAELSWHSAETLAKALRNAAKAYEVREGWTLAGFSLPRHHACDCEGGDQ